MSTYTKYTNNKFLIFLYAILSVFYKSIVILIPLITQNIVDSAISKNSNHLYLYGVFSVLVSIIFIILMYTISKIQVTLYADIDFNIKTQITKRLMFGNYSKIKENDIGYYLQRHNNDISNVRFLYFEKDIDFIINILYCIGLFLSIVLINGYVALMIIITIPIFVSANKRYIPLIEKKAQAYYQEEETLNSNFESLYSNGHALRASKFTPHLFKKYTEQNINTKNKMFSYLLSDEKYEAFIVNGILNLCNCLVYFLGGYLVLINKISVGQMLALAILFARIWSPIEFFLGFKKKVSKAKVSEQRIQDILNVKIEEHETISPEYFNELTINNLSFDYDGNIIFENTSIKFKMNKLYYIKGENGSGKTTLFDIITAIIDIPLSLKIDGIQRENSSQYLKTNIFFIPSEIFIFEKCLSEKTIKYIKETNLLTSNLLNKNIDDLSSGEKRILQLCLALDRKEPILIFDEPLNYIDKNKIPLILNMFEQLKNNHVIILSSHNTDVEQIADYIYQIKNSQIN